MFDFCRANIETIKSLSRAFLEGCLSSAGGTLFILKLIEDIVQLGWNENYKNNMIVKGSVLGPISLLSVLDTYVHFRIYNHQRYDKPDKADQHAGLKKPRDNHIEDGNTNSMPLYDTNDETLTGGRLKRVEEYVRPLLDPSHDTNNAFSWPAFICAISCSIDTASTPLVIMAILRTAGFLASTNDNQRITEIALSTAVGLVSGWNASRLYTMSKKHLDQETDPDHHHCDHDHRCDL